MRLLYFLLPVLLFQNCKAQSRSPTYYKQDNNSLLWEISGNGLGKPSYLFGTFHLMCKEDIHPGTNLINVIKFADAVYFELDLDDPANTLGALLYMRMKGDTTLKTLYTSAEYKKVEGFFRDTLGMPLTFMERIKPLFLQALLYPKMMPCKTMSGVEEVLMKIAKENKKEINGLETIAFQASVFDSVPYSVQATELLKGIDSLAENKIEFESMLNVYKSQRLEDIERLTNGEFEIGQSREVLLDNRNKNWVAQLKTLLPAKSLFIAVGAGHLVGKKGLIALLKQEGYTVRAVQNEGN